jgi:hypothetical protein
MQIIDHGQNDPLEYKPTETDEAIARQIRPHLPGSIGIARALEVLRALKAARTGASPCAYTFDEVNQALTLGVAALSRWAA